MTLPDKPTPEGFRLVPEVAADFPRSRGTGRPTRSDCEVASASVTEHRSAQARSRVRSTARSPRGSSPRASSTPETSPGAADVLSGKTQAAAGVTARGNTLVVRFTRPIGDFAAKTAMPFFCAVPPTLPLGPRGRRPVPRPPARMSSLSIGPARECRSGATASTGVRDRITSTASTSTSGPRARPRSWTGSSAAMRTGGTSSRPATSSREGDSSPSTASTRRSSSSGPVSSSGISSSTAPDRFSATTCR